MERLHRRQIGCLLPVIQEGGTHWESTMHCSRANLGQLIPNLTLATLGTKVFHSISSCSNILIGHLLLAILAGVWITHTMAHRTNLQLGLRIILDNQVVTLPHKK